MHYQEPVDYYEVLQLSPNADADTVGRVYRMLAQRFHPDNKESGNAERFRVVCEAYQVLSDPQRRAKYDVAHQRERKERWRFVSQAGTADSDVEIEQGLRLTVLEVLYTRRRTDAEKPAMYPSELEQLTGTPREHLEFTLWFLLQKKFVQRTDSSLLTITVDGVDHLEQHHQTNGKRQLRLQAASSVA